jgi:hypothetical protein
LVALASDICDEAQCKIGRSGVSIILAVPFFAASSLLVLCRTKNYYPGIERFARPGGPIQLEEEKTPEESSIHEEPHGRTSDGDGDEWPHNRPKEFDGLGDAQEIPISPILLQAMMMKDA